MKKEVKDTIIVDLGEKLKEYPHFYLVDVTGMNAEATSSLRRKCFKQEIKMVVVKNKLLHKAFEAADIDYSELYGTLKGNTAVLFTNTANVPAKLLKDKEIAKAGVHQEQERGYCRHRCSVAEPRKERGFCSSVRRKHYPWCAEDFRRAS